MISVNFFFLLDSFSASSHNAKSPFLGILIMIPFYPYLVKNVVQGSRYYFDVCFKNVGLNILTSWRFTILSFFIHRVILLIDSWSVLISNSSDWICSTASAGPFMFNNSSKCSFHLSFSPDLVAVLPSLDLTGTSFLVWVFAISFVREYSVHCSPLFAASYVSWAMLSM